MIKKFFSSTVTVGSDAENPKVNRETHLEAFYLAASAPVYPNEICVLGLHFLRLG